MDGAPYVYPREIRDHYASWRNAAELAGCKSVVIVTDPDAYAEMDPATRYDFARQLGEHTNRINSRNGALLDERTAAEGSYIAPDSGTGRDDMTVIGATTRWVSSNSPLYGGSDEPSPTTAVGGVHGINATLKVLHMDGDHTSFAIKGAIGAVGSDMARLLRSQYPGAELILADRDNLRGRTEQLADELGGTVQIVPTVQIIGMGDVYIPAAMGADLTEENLDRFVAGGVRIVNGPANGQFPLGREDLMDKYFASGILAVPDYIVNQGGIGQCMQPFVIRNLMSEGLSRREAVVLAGSEMMKARVADIGPVTEYMVKQAIDRGVAPDRVAAEMILEAEARRYIQQGLIPTNM